MPVIDNLTVEVRDLLRELVAEVRLLRQWVDTLVATTPAAPVVTKAPVKKTRNPA